MKSLYHSLRELSIKILILKNIYDNIYSNGGVMILYSMNNTDFNGEEYNKKHNVKKMTSVFSNLGLGLFSYSAVAWVFSTAFIFIFAFVMKIAGRWDIVDRLFDSELFGWGMTIVFNYIIGGGALALVLKKRRIEPCGEIVKRKLSAREAVILGMICITFMQIGSVVSSLLSDAVNAIRGVPLSNPVGEMVSETSITVMFIMCVIIGPVVEEIIYRKLVIDRLRFCGEKFALICSALIFALAHGNFYQVFYSFGFGLVLGYIYIRTNNLKICMAYHMIFNFIGSIVPMLFLRYVDFEANGGAGILIFTAYELLLFAAAVSGFFMLALNLKKINLRKSELTWITTADKIKALVFNPGMILLLLTIVYEFVTSFLE